MLSLQDKDKLVFDAVVKWWPKLTTVEIPLEIIVLAGPAAWRQMWSKVKERRLQSRRKVAETWINFCCARKEIYSWGVVWEPVLLHVREGSMSAGKDVWKWSALPCRSERDWIPSCHPMLFSMAVKLLGTSDRTGGSFTPVIIFSPVGNAFGKCIRYRP